MNSHKRNQPSDESTSYLPLLLVLSCPLNGLAGPHLGMVRAGYSLALTKCQTKTKSQKKNECVFLQTKKSSLSPKNS